MQINREDAICKGLTAGAWTAVMMVVVGILMLLVMTIKADGAISYCYIDSASAIEVPKVFYKLHGYRPWRVDTKLGIFESLDEAVKASERSNCPLRK